MPTSARLLAVALIAAAVMTPLDAAGQGAPLAVEFRGGAAVPVGSFAGGDGGEGAGTGAAFGFEVTLGSSGRRSLYAGFAQLRFPCGAAGCPPGDPWVATGVNAGVRFALWGGERVIPWVALGVLTTRVESPGVAGSPAGVTELGYGAEAGAGLYLAMGGAVALTPAVRIARADTDLPGGRRLGLRYLVADLGVALTF